VFVYTINPTSGLLNLHDNYLYKSTAVLISIQVNPLFTLLKTGGRYLDGPTVRPIANDDMYLNTTTLLPTSNRLWI